MIITVIIVITSITIIFCNIVVVVAACCCWWLACWGDEPIRRNKEVVLDWEGGRMSHRLAGQVIVEIKMWKGKTWEGGCEREERKMRRGARGWGGGRKGEEEKLVDCTVRFLNWLESWYRQLISNHNVIYHTRLARQINRIFMIPDGWMVYSVGATAGVLKRINLGLGRCAPQASAFELMMIRPQVNMTPVYCTYKTDISQNWQYQITRTRLHHSYMSTVTGKVMGEGGGVLWGGGVREKGEGGFTILPRWWQPGAIV